MTEKNKKLSKKLQEKIRNVPPLDRKLQPRVKPKKR